MLVNRFAVLCGFLCVLGLLRPANGQDATSGDGARRYYNIKAGPIYVTLSAQNSVEYVDNVNLSSGIDSPIKADLIVTPSFSINAVSQMQLNPTGETNTNTMGITMNFGYRDHILQPDLNERILDLNISPDSDLFFLIRIGHFKIRLHDQFSLQSDPVTDTSLSNVAVFRRFSNTAGVNVEWDVNSATLINLGYDHTTVRALSLISLDSGTTNNLSTSNINSEADTLSLQGSIKIIPEITVGARSSVSGIHYPGAPWQDSTTYSYGPFAEARLTQYTSLNASCGVSQNEPGDVFVGSNAGNSSNSNSTSEYFNIALTNHLNTYYTQTISTGRQVELNLIGMQTATNYLRYSSVWTMNSHIAWHFDAGVEDATDFGTSNIYNVQSNYRRYTAGLSTSYQFSKKLSTSLNYRYVQKDTSDPLQCYKQNDVIWTVNYRF